MFLMGIALASTADAIAQDVCVDLANAIVFNQSRSFSFDEQRDINRADFCLEQYKGDRTSTSAKIEASYKFFSGGASGSQDRVREEQSKQCDNRFGDFWSKSIKNSSARVASADSLNVVNECLRLNASGMRPRMAMTSDGKEFALTLEWFPSPPTDLRLDYAGPLNFSGYKCSAQSGPQGAFKSVTSGNDVKTTVATGGSFTLSCVRPVDNKQVDGEALACYREALISIASNGPSATLKVPETCTPSMHGSRVAALEQRLQAIDNQLKVTAAALAALGTPSSSAGSGCSILGGVQMCWGTAVLTRNPNAPHTAPFSFTFPRQFLSPPSVTNGINISGSGHAAGVYNNQVGTKSYQGAINNMYISTPISGVITMNYIAIGIPGQ